MIDTKALLDVILIGFGGTLALVVAFGTVVLASDRADIERRQARSASPWVATVAVAAVASVGIVALGVWATTQKS